MTTWIVVAVLAIVWLALAIAITILAARRFKLAEELLSAARANAALLDLTPARPLVVRPDQKIEADPQLVRQLGLNGTPRRLGELIGNDSGIVEDDLEALKEDIAVARASAGRISR